jgi:hypothetical protein
MFTMDPGEAFLHVHRIIVFIVNGGRRRDQPVRSGAFVTVAL